MSVKVIEWVKMQHTFQINYKKHFQLLALSHSKWVMVWGCTVQLNEPVRLFILLSSNKCKP